MIWLILGLALLLIGWVTGIWIIWVIGIVLAVLGLLAVLLSFGTAAVGTTRPWYRSRRYY